MKDHMVSEKTAGNKLEIFHLEGGFTVWTADRSQWKTVLLSDAGRFP